MTALDQQVAVLVGRQSSTRDRETMSVPDQIEKMEGWCATQDPPIAVHSVYTEFDTSGRRPLDKRKGLKQAVLDVEQGEATMIVTAYFDRYVRSVATRAEVLRRVEAKGGKVWTLDMGQDSNATSASMLNGTIMAAIAEFYAMQIGEKVAVRVQKNIDAGIPPFPRVTPAYRKISEGERKGQLEPSEHWDVVREACLMRMQDPPAPYSKIAAFLNENGVRNYTDKPMTTPGIVSMFSSPLLVGEIHFGHFTPNHNAVEKPVLSRAEWRKLQATGGAKKGRRPLSDKLLARQDVLYCACGSRMIVSSSVSRGTRYAYYVCGNPFGTCAHNSKVACDEADLLVATEARRRAKSRTISESDQAEAEAARIEAEEAQRVLSETFEKLLGMEGEDVARDVLVELTGRRDTAVARRDHLSRLHSKLTLNADRDWDPDPKRDHPGLSLEAKRDVIRATIGMRERVVVSPAPSRVHVPLAERVAFELLPATSE